MQLVPSGYSPTPTYRKKIPTMFESIIKMMFRHKSVEARRHESYLAEIKNLIAKGTEDPESVNPAYALMGTAYEDPDNEYGKHKYRLVTQDSFNEATESVGHDIAAAVRAHRKDAEEFAGAITKTTLADNLDVTREEITETLLNLNYTNILRQTYEEPLNFWEALTRPTTRSASNIIAQEREVSKRFIHYFARAIVRELTKISKRKQTPEDK